MLLCSAAASRSPHPTHTVEPCNNRLTLTAPDAHPSVGRPMGQYPAWHTHRMIAITPWRRTLATWVHPRQDLYTINPDYLVGVERAGSRGALVGHVMTVEEAKRGLERFDGLILSGGNDVDPSLYGAPNTASIEPHRAADLSDIAYLEAALALQLPVLAICRGLQVMNVAFGGSLHQDIWGRPAHPPRLGCGDSEADADAFLSNRHDVELTTGSKLHELFASNSIITNSLHHQAADRVGRDLLVTAVAADGTIEGLEHESAPMVGVQWHPERSLDPVPGEPDHQCLFDWLVDP